ncbi:sugar-binding transcriptional regulator [Agrobacterium rhizogenes]|uniref:sugar-binding transcriptional regulator n=1 Tax=Rhizobium TaxID=379 RepID=UPI00026EDC85|nr:MULTISPECIES: sugar-binding transcriptional regulator [Rhizobium]OCI96214.1 DNA-binding transcriptional regulator [Agrobacterium sp. 13-626]OCJ09901.1 DNA-binding transcriptional regulator [Agrobacterium sp. B131/95]EJK79901.1 transcriptional regulator with sigma factor-related N-terminal domain [Rhizobium sp. AP16]NTG43916.1 sugar-binding transcriptional regulator [Rhizobium rhizogenes]NTG47881.1 sugar-binding transcriptional regulator [Rhizobium rhizogenes]
MGRINELRLISRVAQMYHIEHKRQADIAQHLRLSQATVSRMLKRAEAEDIVRTTVIPPAGTYADMEGALRERFNLPEAIVVECSEDRDGAIMERIGEAAAHLLEVTLAQGEIIGVSSWSQTIFKMVENIHPQKSAQAKYIVQTLGGMGDPSVQTHATQLTTRLARLTGGEPKLLTVQGVTSSREAKLLMMADPFVRETIDLFGAISLAIVGIGAVEPSELLARSGNIFSSRELADLADAGAVGDISLRFFDLKGNTVKTPLDERVIGISLEELEKVDRVVALAGGEKKTAAIAGALRVGVIDTLVTDKFTAQRLIDLD